LLATLALAAAPFVTPEQVDWKAVLPKPPEANSDQAKQEIEQMLKLQAHRTADEAKRCQDEESFTPFTFSQVLGSWFNPDDLPETAEFLSQVTSQAAAVSATAKDYYNRPRPYAVDARIDPCLGRPESPSYPSGHSTDAMTLALVLSEMFPEHKDALIAQGKQIGDDRVLGGVHYPSDVDAGRILAKAIFAKMMDSPDFKAAMGKAKDECLAKEPAK
jgi:acid phosphatase (class A)